MLNKANLLEKEIILHEDFPSISQEYLFQDGEMRGQRELNRGVNGARTFDFELPNTTIFNGRVNYLKAAATICKTEEMPSPDFTTIFRTGLNFEDTSIHAKISKSKVTAGLLFALNERTLTNLSCTYNFKKRVSTSAKVMTRLEGLDIEVEGSLDEQAYKCKLFLGNRIQNPAVFLEEVSFQGEVDDKMQHWWMLNLGTRKLFNSFQISGGFKKLTDGFGTRVDVHESNFVVGLENRFDKNLNVTKALGQIYVKERLPISKGLGVRFGLSLLVQHDVPNSLGFSMKID